MSIKYVLLTFVALPIICELNSHYLKNGSIIKHQNILSSLFIDKIYSGFNITSQYKDKN